jgi:hypothetical protein
MKKLLILLFSIFISFNCYGEWNKVATGSGDKNNGDIFYIETDTIKENDGYVYFWQLSDYLLPLQGTFMSSKVYKQGDCGIYRHKILSYIVYKESMGKDAGLQIEGEDEWIYNSSGTVAYIVLDYVCDYVK